MVGIKYLESHIKHIDDKEYVEIDDAYDAADLEMKDLAWQIHVKICKGISLAELDKFVTDICDF